MRHSRVLCKQRYDFLGEPVHRLLVIRHPREAHDEVVKPGIYLLLECLGYLLGRPNYFATRVLLVADLAARHRGRFLRVFACADYMGTKTGRLYDFVVVSSNVVAVTLEHL